MDALLAAFSSELEELWEDREVRFDVSPSQKTCRAGEEVLEVLDPVEDTKGNNGMKGQLVTTNLRIMWTSATSKRLNISIGLGCIIGVNITSTESRLKGHTQSLRIMTRHQEQRFEFLFTCLAGEDTAGVLARVQAVWKAHDASRMYRELRLRGSVIQDRELRMLPLEQTYSKVAGVWNLTSDQGNLGTFFISNVRVVWFASSADSFNVSIPYIQLSSVSVRDSKFGKALVLESSPSSGGYVLGFKIDPKETLDYVLKEITSLRKAYLQHPQFGVEADMHATERQAAALAQLKLSAQEEDVVVVDTGDRGDVLATYCAEPFTGGDREPVYCAELGLAVEALREGTTLENLWMAV